MLRRLLICSTLVLATAAPASAGTIGVELTFAPGRLSLQAAPAKLTPGARVSVPVTVADGRGSGRGWRLRLVGSPEVSVLSVTATCAAGSTCTLPAAAGRPSGATVLRAASGTGMGIVKLVVTLTSPSSTLVSFSVS